MRTYILASRSPRRKELLEEMGLSFTVVSMEIEEHLRTDIELTKAVEQLAYEKAEAVARCHPESIVIGADTVVALGAQVFGKPKDEMQAREMLRALSGKRHQVIGGVAVLSAQPQVTFSSIRSAKRRSRTISAAGSRWIRPVPMASRGWANGLWKASRGIILTWSACRFPVCCAYWRDLKRIIAEIARRILHLNSYLETFCKK